MKNILILITTITLVFTLNGCSLGFLASKEQAITIVKDSGTTVLINKKIPLIQDGKYILKKDGIPKQIDIIREGYKPETKILPQNKFSALFWTSIAMNTVIGGILGETIGRNSKDEMNAGGSEALTIVGTWFGFCTGLAGAAMSPKLINYENSITLHTPSLKITRKDSTMKEVYLNKTTFDVSKTNVKYQVMSYKNYLKGNNKIKHKSSSKKDIKVEDSTISNEINNILKKNGFIDTSGLILKGNYGRNLFLNVTIDEISFNRVLCNFRRIIGATKYYEELFHSFSTVSIKTKWDVLDVYKKTIYSDTLTLKSDEIIDNDSTDTEDLVEEHIKSAMETGLYTLMNSPKFMKEVKIQQSEVTNSPAKFEIPAPKKTVGSMEDAVGACVTIKTAAGHGSGFIISENGFIITNYHVVADSSKLEIILNESKFKATILNVNKEADLALLKIEKTGLIPFDASGNVTYDIGNEVYAIGTPEAEDLSQTVSKGIISSVRKQANGSKLIQTDVSINKGNSGGPLVDNNGKLIGVVNSKLSGVGTEGISFVIPLDIVLKALKISYK